MTKVGDSSLGRFEGLLLHEEPTMVPELGMEGKCGHVLEKDAFLATVDCDTLQLMEDALPLWYILQFHVDSMTGEDGRRVVSDSRYLPDKKRPLPPRSKFTLSINTLAFARFVSNLNRQKCKSNDCISSPKA